MTLALYIISALLLIFVIALGMGLANEMEETRNLKHKLGKAEKELATLRSSSITHNQTSVTMSKIMEKQAEEKERLQACIDAIEVIIVEALKEEGNADPQKEN